MEITPFYLMDKLLLPAMGALAATVIAVWRSFQGNWKRTQDKLDKCEDLHRKTEGRIVELTGEVGELRGRQQAVESLGAAVIEEIRKLKE